MNYDIDGRVFNGEEKSSLDRLFRQIRITNLLSIYSNLSVHIIIIYKTLCILQSIVSSININLPSFDID